MKQITPEQYEKLKGMDRLGWTPEYIGYKTKKVREYRECDEGFSHFIGWEEHSYPIGDPLKYVYHQPSMMERLEYETAQHFMAQWAKKESVFNEPATSGETVKINFTRYTPLDDK